MRNQDHLEDYERGDFDFENYCTEMIKENFYEYYDFIECSTEQYDHKRGCTTVTATLETTVGDLRNAGDIHPESTFETLTGWTASFAANNGNMTVDI